MVVFGAVGFGAGWFVAHVALRDGHITIGTVWPLLPIQLVLAAIVFGLSGSLTSVHAATVVFDSAAAMEDGDYVVFGERQGRMFLATCSSPDDPISVRSDLIITEGLIDLKAQGLQSVYSMIRDRDVRDWGFEPECKP